jgi:hypothetical protein
MGVKNVEKGYLAMVLHAHLPFVRHPEHEDSLEEHWLYEALTETYVPLLRKLDTLVEEDIDFRLTLSLTPTLAFMLDDHLLQSRYVRRLENLIELGEKERRRTKHQPDLNRLACMYHQHFTEVHKAFLDRFDRGAVKAPPAQAAAHPVHARPRAARRHAGPGGPEARDAGQAPGDLPGMGLAGEVIAEEASYPWESEYQHRNKVVLVRFGVR